MEVNSYDENDNQQNYIQMGPKMPLDHPDEELYMEMLGRENQEKGTLDIEWLHHSTSGSPLRNRFSSTVLSKHSYKRFSCCIKFELFFSN